MSDREAILDRIRRARRDPHDDAVRRATVTDRLVRHPAGLVPARGRVEGEARLALFTGKAEAVSATVVRVGDAAAVPAAVADYLRARNLPQAVRRGGDPRLAALPFDGEPQMTVTIGASEGHDLVGLSHAFAGVAETGTLVLLSGPDNPTTLDFLPDHHIVVVAAEDVVGDYETVWTRLRERLGEGVMPRALHMITGPSRSGDIEQTILLGAHGPRALHIVVVG